MINNNSILLKSSSVVVRKETNHYLLYSVSSDELHLIPLNSYFIYELCNGFLTVNEIENLALNNFFINENNDDVNSAIREFLQNLVNRKLLEVYDNVVGINNKI